MHIYTYQCTVCEEEYEVVMESEQGFSPGRFLFCDECLKLTVFVPIEHVEVEM